jgi:tetratricopeptide (TPR) repeat protein
MDSARFTSIAAATLFFLGMPFAAAAWEPPGSVMEIGGARLSLSSQEMKALSELGGLVRGGGQAARQDRALEEARRVASSRDARHVLALYELELGNQRRDDAMRAKALDVLITSPMTRSERLPGYLGVRGQIAYRAGDFDMAGRLWSQLAELTPDDPDSLANLAQVRLAQKDAPGAMDLLDRAIVARKASGKEPSEIWYRQRLSIAQQGNLVEPGIAAARALVGAYPTPENWRIALVVYRQLGTLDEGFEIDLLRLMRRVGVLTQAAEYQRMAQLLRQSGEIAEAKAVLAEGIGRSLLDAGTSPTREIIAEVDRATAKKQAAGLAQPVGAGAKVRLGMSRLLTGQRAEAETVFRAAAADASGGRYADLAFFWLTWLGQRPVS